TTDPLNGQTNVPVTSVVLATFDEPVDPLTVTNINFKLVGPSGEVTGTVAYNTVTLTATFTPSTFLEGGVLYTATISNIKDIAGNIMAAPYAWAFTTKVPTWDPGDDPSFWNQTGGGGAGCVSNWVQTDTTYVSPPYSWYYQIPAGNDSKNNDCALASANLIDLTGLTTATLGFYQQMFLKDNGPSDDYGLVEVCLASADCTQPANWTTLAQYSGKFSWRRDTIDLSLYTGQQIYLRLGLYTDGQIPSQYWYYDDLIITGT
ncbi:MAG TPA: Ig-like domain-containing protein, partial [bacterium]